MPSIARSSAGRGIPYNLRSSAVSTPASAPPRRLGRYALHGEIAAGGMASVHLGRLLGPVGFSRTVAIKQLHAHFAKDPAFVAMFLDEARLAARIRHPNVVPTLDVIELDGEIFLVMEYVHGESLAKLVRASNVADANVPVGVAASIVANVLHGLHAAHEARSERGKALEIVHRDVSPQNVLVGVDGVARVLDFGIAKATSRLQTTQEGQLKGKLPYMAPEQIELQDVDRRVDVYASSVVLWEALTGRRLFVENNPARLMKQVLDGVTMRPSELASSVPTELEAIVMRGLSRDPGDRFATAREMAIALEDTGICASSRTIGEWVERMVGDSLGERAGRLREIEETSEVGIESIVKTKVKAPNVAAAADPEQGSLLITHVEPTLTVPRRRGRAVAIATLGFGALVALIVGKSLLSAEPTKARVDAASGAISLTGATSAAAPSASPSSVAVTSPAPATSSASSTAHATAAPPIATASAAKPKPPPRPKVRPPTIDCSPPYTTDDQGVRIPKRECL